MKNQIALPASQARESRISLWLNRENCIFSALMEERVSNRQAVLVSQVLASFSILSCSFLFIGWLPLLACAGLSVPFCFARKEVCDDRLHATTRNVSRRQISGIRDGKVLFEQYTILMYGSDKLCCTRPEMEQLSELIQTALNDRKEADHGK